MHLNVSTDTRTHFQLCSPMPKQAANWGSRPVFGRDWGESVYCCKNAIDTCSQIFAKSWFTSGQCCLHSHQFCYRFTKYLSIMVIDFCDNEELSCKYHVSLDEGETFKCIYIYKNRFLRFIRDNPMMQSWSLLWINQVVTWMRRLKRFQAALLNRWSTCW